MCFCAEECPASAVRLIGVIPGYKIQVSSKQRLLTTGDSWLLAKFRQSESTRRHRLECNETSQFVNVVHFIGKCAVVSEKEQEPVLCVYV